jgi:hypothetical protein
MNTRKLFNVAMVCVVCVSVAGVLPAISGCGYYDDDALGMADWERDILFGSLGLAALLRPIPAGDEALFSVWIDDFFGANTAELLLGVGGAEKIEEPVLGRVPLDPDNNVSYRVAIPDTYGGTNPVTMRLQMQRLGQLGAGNLALSFNMWRLVDGAGTPETYIAGQAVAVDATATAGEFHVLTLPITVAVPGGLGGAPLSAGDLLVVEIESTESDGGEYLLLGVEFFESTTSPGVSGGTIL